MTELTGCHRLDECDINEFLKASGSELRSSLQSALARLPFDALPFTQCCERGGMVEREGWSIDLLNAERADSRIVARLGLFFTEVVGGCNCHDDPVRYNEYRVLELVIDCPTGRLTWKLD